MAHFKIQLTAEYPFAGIYETQADSVDKAVRNLCYRIGQQYSLSTQTCTLRSYTILKNKQYKVLESRSSDVLPSSGFVNDPSAGKLDDVLRDQLVEQAKKPFNMFTPDPDDVDEGTYSERAE